MTGFSPLRSLAGVDESPEAVEVGRPPERDDDCADDVELQVEDDVREVVLGEQRLAARGCGGQFEAELDYLSYGLL